MFDRLRFLPIHHHHIWLFVGSYRPPSCFLHLMGYHLPFLIYPLSEAVNVANVIFKSRFISQMTCCPTFWHCRGIKLTTRILVKIFLKKVIKYRIVIGCFHSRGQNPCKFIWTKKNRLQKKRVQFPQDWFRTLIWPLCCHVKTFYGLLLTFISALSFCQNSFAVILIVPETTRYTVPPRGLGNMFAPDHVCPNVHKAWTP